MAEFTKRDIAANAVNMISAFSNQDFTKDFLTGNSENIKNVISGLNLTDLAYFNEYPNVDATKAQYSLVESMAKKNPEQIATIKDYIITSEMDSIIADNRAKDLVNKTIELFNINSEEISNTVKTI